MRTTEVLQKVLPESWGIDAIHRVVEAERNEGWTPDPLFRLEAIMPPHRARIDALAERLRLSRAEATRLHAWADAPEADPAQTEALLARTIYRSGRQGVEDRNRHALARESEAGNAQAVATLRAQAAFLENWRPPVFPLSGSDLVAAGMQPGPDVGKRLRELETRWIESGFSLSREQLLGA